MKKINFIKKENKKFALLSMLFLILSCSNKTENNSENYSKCRTAKDNFPGRTAKIH